MKLLMQKENISKQSFCQLVRQMLTLTLNTDGDRVDEINGQIIAWVRAGVGYTISPLQSSAWVAVNDDRCPDHFCNH